jgi:hypothetical protein
MVGAAAFEVLVDAAVPEADEAELVAVTVELAELDDVVAAV